MLHVWSILVHLKAFLVETQLQAPKFLCHQHLLQTPSLRAVKLHHITKFRVTSNDGIRLATSGLDQEIVEQSAFSILIQSLPEFIDSLIERAMAEIFTSATQPLWQSG